MVTEKQLVDLFEEAKKNKDGLALLKQTALVCQKYELAANLRMLEIELFPETKGKSKFKNDLK
jgi:hypothetical protein